MSRVKLLNGQQSKFLNRVAEYFDLDWTKIARVSNICDRTLRAWRAEEYNMSYEALIKLHKVSNISIPKIVSILPEYWSAKKFARKGALRRYELYGDLGTQEGRRRGGINVQRLFRSNPKYAALLGIKTRKPINEPKLSVDLAEFIGIMLGDGGMTKYQINVTFNTQTDKEYGIYINKLIKRLFLISPIIITTNCDNADRIIASSKNLVQFLQEKGLKIGNKVKQRVDVPAWILNNKNYAKSCLRGLIDTDGSFYAYGHKVFKKKYYNFAMCFTSHSKPLLKSVTRILKSLNFSPVTDAKHVYLHKRLDIDSYFSEIGSHNLKHIRKYRNYIDLKDR